MRGETVIVLTGTAVTDPYSGEASGLSWATPTELSVPNVLCEPRPSGEPVQDARNAVTSGWTLYVRKRASMPTITPENRVRVRGIDFDVLGEASDWRLDAFGGLVVQTERTEG